MTGLNPQDMGDDWHEKINLSDDLKNILRKMIHDEYKYRYHSAQDVINHLRNPPTIQKTQFIPTHKSNDLNTKSESDMIYIILFGLLVVAMSTSLFNIAMLPGIKNKEYQKRQSFLLEKVVMKTMKPDISNLCPNLVKLL
jgi:serine/threonine protein kinase